MSLASNTVFEVRPATGSDTNGGGFVTGSGGTDYSQQASPQLSVSDASCSASPDITSATGGFTPAMVGSIMYLSSGPGWYQITAYSSSHQVTIDRNGPTASGMTCNVGGALASINKAESLLTAGMTAWIKADGTSQTLTTPLVTVNSGDSTSGPITWQGYHTTRGDHDGTRPLITSSTNSVDLLRCASGNTSYRIFDNIEWSSTAGTPGNAVATDTGSGGWRLVTISNCYFHGVKNGIIADNSSYNSARQLFVINTEITGCTADGLNISDATTILGCYIHGNAGYGLRVSNPPSSSITVFGLPVVLRSSVFYSNSLGGAYIQAASASSNTSGFLFDIDRCAFVSNTNDGIQNASASGELSMLSLQNSICYGNSGYGVNIANVAATVVVNRNNAYGNNSSGARNNLVTGTGDVALTADPFTARTGNDFSLNSTAGGGATCKAAGFPGSIAGTVTPGYADIGALQTQATGSTSVTNIISAPRRVQSTAPRTTRRTSVLIAGGTTLAVTNIICRPRRVVFSSPPGTRNFRRPPIVIAEPGLPLVIRRRQIHQSICPVRHHGPAILLAACPIVLRSPPRALERRLPGPRRNAGNALFANAGSLVVSHPRLVR